MSPNTTIEELLEKLREEVKATPDMSTEDVLEAAIPRVRRYNGILDKLCKQLSYDYEYHTK